MSPPGLRSELWKTHSLTGGLNSPADQPTPARQGQRPRSAQLGHLPGSHLADVPSHSCCERSDSSLMRAVGFRPRGGLRLPDRDEHRYPTPLRGVRTLSHSLRHFRGLRPRLAALAPHGRPAPWRSRWRCGPVGGVRILPTGVGQRGEGGQVRTGVVAVARWPTGAAPWPPCGCSDLGSGPPCAVGPFDEVGVGRCPRRSESNGISMVG